MNQMKENSVSTIKSLFVRDEVSMPKLLTSVVTYTQIFLAFNYNWKLAEKVCVYVTTEDDD